VVSRWRGALDREQLRAALAGRGPATARATSSSSASTSEGAPAADD
jgi:hypothetical protein